MQTTLIPQCRDAAGGLEFEPAPPAALLTDVDMELSDDELEAVVGGLARVHLPRTVISAAQAPA